MKKAWVLSYPLSTQRRLWSQTGRMPRLIWVFAGHTVTVGFVMSRLICFLLSMQRVWFTFCLTDHKETKTHLIESLQVADQSSCGCTWSSFQRLSSVHDQSTDQEHDTIEPTHEIMVLFVLRKLILQTRMRCLPVGLDVWIRVGLFVFFHTSCMRTALARLRECAGSPEPSLVAYVISTIISWAGS